jgi:uncharacterized protein (TIGR00266 family)
MEFFIESEPVFTILRVKLDAGESFRAEPGAMLAMSPTIELKALSSGKGVLGSFKAAVGGESFFASLFTASGAGGEIILAPHSVGDIIKLDLQNETIYAHGGAYLAGHPDLELSTRGSAKAMLAGEGFFLSKITGTGPLFLHSYGAIIEKTLQPGEDYIVDTGHIVAFEERIGYTIKRVSKGLFTTIASKEGLVCEYQGPGKIWLQSRNLKNFAQLIAEILPKT